MLTPESKEARGKVSGDKRGRRGKKDKDMVEMSVRAEQARPYRRW